MMTKVMRVGMIGDHVLSLSPLRSKNSTIVEVYVALGQEPTPPLHSPMFTHRRQGALLRECLQIVAHDRTTRRAASDFLEADARERRGCADENIRRALRCAGVDRISLERRCLPTLCGLHGRGDKL